MTRPQITPAVVEALTVAVGRRPAMAWVYLWSCADWETSIAWPSTATIGRAIQTNRNHVVEDIRKLEAAGWLRVEHRGGSSNRYTVLVPAPLWCNQDGTTTDGGCIQDGTSPVSTTGQGVYPPRDITCIQGGTQNTRRNTIRKRAPAFVPPTIEEVRAYCQSEGLLEPDAFFDHFTANGWLVSGKTPMKDWKAAARQWERNRKRFEKAGVNGNGNGNGQAPKRSPYDKPLPLLN